ncbi:MAG: hypothetical protein AAGJ35_07670 [Myxococcota bacterium]
MRIVFFALFSLGLLFSSCGQPEETNPSLTLPGTRDIEDKTKDADDKMKDIKDKTKDVDDKIKDIEDKTKGVDDKVKDHYPRTIKLNCNGTFILDRVFKSKASCEAFAQSNSFPCNGGNMSIEC